MDYVDDDLSKYNLNTKIQIKANDWLKFNFNNNLTLNMIRRPMANQTIFYATLGNQYPNTSTILPVNSAYNIPTWNERLYLQNSKL